MTSLKLVMARMLKADSDSCTHGTWHTWDGGQEQVSIQGSKHADTSKDDHKALDTRGDGQGSIQGSK